MSSYQERKALHVVCLRSEFPVSARQNRWPMGMFLMQHDTVMIPHTASWNTSGVLGHTPCPHGIFYFSTTVPFKASSSAMMLLCAGSCLWPTSLLSPPSQQDICSVPSTRSINARMFVRALHNHALMATTVWHPLDGLCLLLTILTQSILPADPDLPPSLHQVCL